MWRRAQAVGTAALRELPWPYLRNLIACNLATKVVYTEGLAYVNSLPTEDQEVADVAFRYVHHSLQVVELIKQVQGSGIEAADEVTDLLKRTRVESALTLALPRQGCAEPRMTRQFGRQLGIEACSSHLVVETNLYIFGWHCMDIYEILCVNSKVIETKYIYGLHSEDMYVYRRKNVLHL
eukprot:420643-Pyramimonas_sp.AAC.3